MPASTDLREGLAEAFDTLADEFNSGLTIYLAEVDPSTDEFNDAYLIASARFFEYSNYRKNFLLEIASNDSAITTAMATATHVKVGSEYFPIIQADTVPPTTSDATWKIYVERFEHRRTHYAAL